MTRRFTITIMGLSLFALLGCKEENVTNNYGPEDWQPPVLTWLAPPEAELRGTVGLDVQVLDSSLIDRVTLFVDGSENQSINQTPYRFELHSDSLTDGVHLCEARAWDQFGNLGISPVLRVLAANGFPEGIRVLWVPDSFATIQSAINASQDYDTIRVRDGFYDEMLDTFGKAFRLETEHGPMFCTVSGRGSWNTILVASSEHPVTIRGFALTGAVVPVRMDAGAQCILVNNFLLRDTVSTHDPTWSLLITDWSGGSIRNNWLLGSEWSAQIAYFFGDFQNNIVQDASDGGLFNAALHLNPLFHGYNAFWNNGLDYQGFTPGLGEFNADPLVNWAGGQLWPNSPCIDTGNPEILDLDGTRSDIGPFGGPLGYR